MVISYNYMYEAKQVEGGSSFETNYGDFQLNALLIWPPTFALQSQNS